MVINHHLETCATRRPLLVTTSLSRSDRMDNLLKDHRWPSLLNRIVDTALIPRYIDVEEGREEDNSKDAESLFQHYEP